MIKTFILCAIAAFPFCIGIRIVIGEVFPTFAFKWFGLPLKAKDSRWAALGGLLLAALVLAIFYGATNQLAEARGVSVFDPSQLFVVAGRSLDSRVPYLPWTLVIYATLWWSYLVPVLVYPKTESGARELFQLYSGLVAVTVVAALAFLLCPTEISLRAEAAPAVRTAFHDLNLLMRAVDQPYNTWPCLHVAQPALMVLVLTRWLRKPHWTLLLWTWWVVVGISTLTVKQHFIWDILTGALLGLGYCFWKLRPDPSVSQRLGRGIG